MITFVALWRRLVPLYDEPEARAIVRLLLEKKYNMSLADICVGKLEELPPSDAETLEQAMKRLQAGEPIQYVVGEEQFGSRSFLVTPHVLIPRPETLELCEWIEEEGQGRSAILDIGTGSGCIAITLALDMPDTKVTAWDISAEALSVARQNASRLHADVLFELVDVLGEKPEQCYDMIVSNPPYIAEHEAATMQKNVVDWEPRLALFVSDNRPLLFYEAIADYADKHLNTGGFLFFEINPLFSQQLMEMLDKHGFKEVELRTDQFGKSRMIKAVKA